MDRLAASPHLLVGIDIGGTFTDSIVVDPVDRRVLTAFKTPSTPGEPAAAVFAALARVAETLDLTGAIICHGTTIGTNTLIERAGAVTALVATRGFADVIELRRQDRPTLYDLAVEISAPLVPPALRFEVDERVAASGEILEALTGVDELVNRVRQAGIRSIAISLLHAYANRAHERALKEAIQRHLPGVFVTLSSEINPEYGEYERTSTTVVNAYIGPSVKEYVRELDTRLYDRGIGQLLIVKSNGGLTSATNSMQFPAQLIESGPAAAMIATAAYARRIERPNVIAFDMGGTTAKAGVISGFEPRMISEFRADALKGGRNIGGYPIRGSVLDIVEIGSGGGSIASIDAAGVPKVGPESAGADPGPACYDRGGARPTVTDAHAVIGTLTAETFHGTGVAFSRERAVEAIRESVANPLGWTVERAAHAIISIAVANMTEMVKLATVRRGLDPRDFTLVASGGAGPLHAALVGGEIGVRETIIPPYPGMFSAYGATLGRVRHDVAQSLLVHVDELTAEVLAETFADLDRRVAAILAEESTNGAHLVTRRSASCRYVGQLWELVVPLGVTGELLPAAVDIEQGFRDAYRSEFGIDLSMAKVELVKLQLTVTLEPDNPSSGFTASLVTAREVTPVRTQPWISVDGRAVEIPVYVTNRAIGLSRQGPLIVEHEGATVWVGEEDHACIRSDGCVVITHPSQRLPGVERTRCPGSDPVPVSILQSDPVTFEVIKNSLYAICAEMKSVIMRTSFSPLLSLSADLSCALLDTRGNVVGQGVDIPVHLGAASLSAQAALAHFPLEGLEEGDGILLNDPYEGGTHLPDVTLVTPVFADGRIIALAVSRIHWPDIGGIAAGSSSVTDEIIKEGLRIPPVRVLERGTVREDVMRLIFANVRVPEDRHGDFLAALAGHRRAGQRMDELCERYGAGVVEAVMADSLDYSRRLISARLAALPDADVENEETLDGDGIDPAATPTVRVRISKRGERMTFDFSGSSPCVSGPINCSLPMTTAIVYYTILALTGGQIAPNSGAYAGVEIVAPRGTVMHAVNPYPVVAANTETSNRVVDIVMGALAKAYPDLVAGGGYGSACVYTLGGFDPERGRRFVHYETIGGGMGATAQGPGANGIRVHMGNTMNLPVEGIEAALPVRFVEYRIIRGSGGAGRHRGGCGARKSVMALVDGIEASVLGERTRTPARGIAGGSEGARARFSLHTACGTRELDAKSGPHRLLCHDVLEMTTAGGGGYGHISS